LESVVVENIPQTQHAGVIEIDIELRVGDGGAVDDDLGVAARAKQAEVSTGDGIELALAVVRTAMGENQTAVGQDAAAGDEMRIPVAEDGQAVATEIGGTVECDADGCGGEKPHFGIGAEDHGRRERQAAVVDGDAGGAEGERLGAIDGDVLARVVDMDALPGEVRAKVDSGRAAGAVPDSGMVRPGNHAAGPGGRQVECQAIISLDDVLGAGAAGKGQAGEEWEMEAGFHEMVVNIGRE